MQKFSLIFLLLVSCLLFGGCPYETQVPIDMPTIKVNPDFLGDWTDSQNKNDTYTVSKQDDFTYHIIKAKTGASDSEDYSAYASLVNGVIFLNLWENKPDETTHSFVLYKLEDSRDNITVTEVTENIDEQFSASEQLKKFIAGNMKNSYFFSKEEIVLVRPDK